ncbi:Histidinol-phosphate aminotransferase [Sporomusa silvacetica DSM 10669]|uniref:Histidinol-phosphate aminotransferase n=1 Tax=Sporomusa silvacetica DSM 10669 TaxID=1123289 RepID=A0ABZ3IRT4_9FIRM|nr:pyridoxal phosphate-dependent aminotransferase [Sporomusa silvacetica]OZC15342.1 histidinol-phosphate aminotransferase [Sporomusa silvacetica DSM 10669]
MNTKEKFTGYLFGHEQLRYDGRHGDVIDLGLGVSPLGPAAELTARLANRNDTTWLPELAHYPQDPTHRETCRMLLDGMDMTDVPAEAVVFSSQGSIGAADEVVRFLARQGYHTLFVPTYSFPDIYRLAMRSGLRYRPVSGMSLNPLDAAAAMLKLNRSELKGAIVYLDYPNNPFGGADAELMRRLTVHAVRHGALPLVDLAFAEILGDEFRQAAKFVVDNGGIILGSLSKTQGLPHLRLGYAVVSPALLDKGYSGAQRLLFLLSPLANLILRTLFERSPGQEHLAWHHARRVREHNCRTNRLLYEGLRDMGLAVGCTDERSHLQVVMAKVPDLWQRLMLHGVITESLQDYDITLKGCSARCAPLGHQAVRLLTPAPGQLTEVLFRIEQAQSDSYKEAL